MGRWPVLSSWAQASVRARARPFPSLNPHSNQPSGHWPCVKPCLVGGSDKYNSSKRWAGTHFGRPCWSVHEFCWECPGSAGSQSSRLTWIPVDRHPRASGGRPQALTLLRGARFISWCLQCLFLGECRRDPKPFWSHRACLAYGPALGPAYKKVSCHTRPVGGTKDKYRLPPSSRTWQFWMDPSTCSTNTYFVYMFCFYVLYICFCSGTLVPPNFSSSMSSFLPLTGHYSSISENAHRHQNTRFSLVYQINLPFLFLFFICCSAR